MSNQVQTRFAHMKDLLQAPDESRKKDLSNPEHEAQPLPYRWEEMVQKAMREGDLEGMKLGALVAAQLNMLHLAHSSSSESVRFSASAFLLSQGGHGPMTRVEHTIEYKKMPAEQLKSIISAKLASIKRRNPKFDIVGILSSAKDSVIEVESVPRETSSSDLDEFQIPEVIDGAE